MYASYFVLFLQLFLNHCTPRDCSCHEHARNAFFCARFFLLHTHAMHTRRRCVCVALTYTDIYTSKASKVKTRSTPDVSCPPALEAAADATNKAKVLVERGGVESRGGVAVHRAGRA